MLDRAAGEAAERLLRAMFLSGVQGRVDLLTDEAGQAFRIRLGMDPGQATELAMRLQELGPPRGLILRSLARLGRIVARSF